MQTRPDRSSRDRPIVAFGPEMPGWGSWDWVGADLVEELGRYFDTRRFAAWEVPDCDLAVLVKHAPPPGWVERLTRRSALIYAPVDRYGDAAEIDADAPWLRRCARVLVHCERLRRYFEPYAPVEYVDHHVKFAAPPRSVFREEGNVLWAGVRTNLPPLVAWVNEHPPPAPLEVLTNLEEPTGASDPVGLGFRADLDVRVLPWSPESQVERTAAARGVMDVKGDDFRSRHKPPAKGIDFVASGVPLAMNADGTTVEHLGRMGFEICSPLDVARWLSRAYWEDTRRFGAALAELLSRERIGLRYRRIISSVPARRI